MCRGAHVAIGSGLRALHICSGGGGKPLIFNGQSRVHMTGCDAIRSLKMSVEVFRTAPPLTHMFMHMVTILTWDNLQP